MDYTKLFPLIDLLNGKASHNEWISSIFVLAVIVILLLSCIWARYAYWTSSKKIKVFKVALKGLNQDNLHEKRRDIRHVIEKSDKSCGLLWKEFDESLVLTVNPPSLRNSLDAEHFFSTQTLSRSLTENRLIAAVPGFLTAIGVIGTFLGLTIGLSGLIVGGGADTEELTKGIQVMISGAAVAFVTSVWGVATSLVFNVYEKLLERAVRGKIYDLQNQIDFLFPRITAEQSLVQITDYSKNTDEAIQVLAEKIGDTMQEAIGDIALTINAGLKEVLEGIMAPAIESLVSNANGSAQSALDGLMERFIERIGSAGDEQNEMMKSASQDVSSAVSGLSKELSSFVSDFKLQSNEVEKRISDNFFKIEEREKARSIQQEKQLNEILSRNQYSMSELAEREKTRSEQQEKQLNDSVESTQYLLNKLLEREEERSVQHEKQLKDIVASNQYAMKQLDEREQARVSQQERQLNELAARSQQLMNQLGLSLENQFENQNEIVKQQSTAFNSSLEGMQKVQSDLIGEVEKIIEMQKQSSQAVIDNISALEGKISSMVDGNKLAAESLKRASIEMTGSTNKLDLMAAKVQETTLTFAEINKEAADIMDSVTQAHKELIDKASTLTDAFSETQNNMMAVTKDLKDAALYAESGLKAVDQNMNKFIDDMSAQVELLEAQAANLLEEFAKRVSDQTRQRMSEWNEQTNQYSESMVRVVNTINSVVSEIDSKVGVN